MIIEVKISKKPVDYLKSIKILEKRVESVFKGQKKEFLWILEHKPVYTAGKSYSKNEILDKRINVIDTNRGGKITYHGPGQKVIYFVLNLNTRKKNIRYLITKLEKCVTTILKNYKIESFPDKKNIGIWVKKKKETKKIAAIGIRVRKWIAYHGFSLNVSTDLTKYKSIIPCGIKDKSTTSLKDLGVKNCKNIEKIIVKNFLNFFL